MRCRLLALVVVPLVLVGCSGDPAVSVPTGEHAPTTPMTYYPSPTTSAPTPAASGVVSTAAASSGAPTVAGDLPVPVLPAEAKANTPDGAAAFGRYYVDLVGYAWQKPDARLMAALADATCTTCADWVKMSNDMRVRGDRADRAPLSVVSADPGVRLPTGEQTVITVLRAEPYQRLTKNRAKSAAAKVETLRLQWYLVWAQQGWRVAAIETTA